jgi:tRNA pseudouridine55 synthase
VTAAAPDGVLVVDKTAGPTSHDVVAVARRALATSRVGHTGTLDPMATGVLVLVSGRATRLAKYLAHDIKGYEAHVTFGRATTTYDAEGAATAESGRVPERAALEAALATLAAARTQVPPAYSAKKVDGEIAHRAARRDAPLALPPVAVTVHRLALVAYADGIATLALDVSAGFYVRSLAHDLGVAVGTGAFLSALRRTRAGAFDLGQAVPFGELAAVPRGGARDRLLALDTLLPGLPAVTLSADGARRIRHGQTVSGTVPDGAAAGPVRLVDEAGHLVAIARPAPAGGGAVLLQPVVVLG